MNDCENDGNAFLAIIGTILGFVTGIIYWVIALWILFHVIRASFVEPVQNSHDAGLCWFGWTILLFLIGLVVLAVVDPAIEPSEWWAWGFIAFAGVITAIRSAPPQKGGTKRRRKLKANSK